MAMQTRLSPEAREQREKRNVGPFTGVAMALLTSTRSGATGFGLWSADNQVDLFAKAAAFDRPGENPFNNFLDASAKPLFTIWPKAIGLYLGDGLSDGTQRAKSVIVEHGFIEVKAQEGGYAAKQPVITAPPGLGISIRSTDAVRYDEQFGPLHPVGLFAVPEETVWSKTEKLTGVLRLSKDAVTELTGYAGSFQGSGAVIGFIVHGVAEYPIQGR